MTIAALTVVGVSLALASVAFAAGIALTNTFGQSWTLLVLLPQIPGVGGAFILSGPVVVIDRWNVKWAEPVVPEGATCEDTVAELNQAADRNLTLLRSYWLRVAGPTGLMITGLALSLVIGETTLGEGARWIPLWVSPPVGIAMIGLGIVIGQEANRLRTAALAGRERQEDPDKLP